MHYSRGLTALEVLVWIGIFVFTLGAIVSSIIYFYRINATTINQAHSVTSAQRGIEKMVRTIREAAFASDGAYPIVSLDDNEFSFYADTDSDAFIEKVRYFLNGNSIVEGVVDPSGDPPVYTGSEVTDDISDYVRNTEESLVMFTYYDAAGAQIIDYTDVAAVRFVTVNIIVDVDENNLPEPFHIRSSAAIRNLQ